MEERAIAMAMSASSFENTFKQAQVLKLNKKPDDALVKFRSVCESIEHVVNSNPSANVELHLIPLSLKEISEIYQQKDAYDKALEYMKTSRQFLEYMFANRPNREGENSDDGAMGDKEEYTLGSLFVRMHKCFDMEDPEPKPDAQEIVKMFQEAKKKEEEETARKNLEMLKRSTEERKEKLRNSRWLRFLEYVNDHPIAIAIGSIVFLGIFLAFSLVIFNNDAFDKNPEAAKIRARREEMKKNQKAGNGEPPKPRRTISPEEMERFTEMMSKSRERMEQEERERRSKDSASKNAKEGGEQKGNVGKESINTEL